MTREDDIDLQDTVLSGDPELSDDQRLQAVVVGTGIFQIFPLPARGDLTIGRYVRSDIRIDDNSISRFHARLHMGPPLTIEDLGSSNGTRVGDQVAKPGRALPVHLGEPIRLGDVTMIVQRRSATLIPRPA